MILKYELGGFNTKRYIIYNWGIIDPWQRIDWKAIPAPRVVGIVGFGIVGVTKTKEITRHRNKGDHIHIRNQIIAEFKWGYLSKMF